MVHQGHSGKKPMSLKRTATIASAAFISGSISAEDANSARVIADTGVEIAQMSQQKFDGWRTLAQGKSYKAVVEETPGGQELLDLALSVE